MNRTSAMTLLVCVLAVACEKDPARSLKLTDPHSGHVANAANAASARAIAKPSVAGAATAPPSTSAAPVKPEAQATAGTNATPDPHATAEAPAATIDARSRHAGKSPHGAAGERGTAGATLAQSKPQAWRPPGCPVPTEMGSGPSTFKVAGPCAFAQHARFACEASGDDLYISTTRKAAGGATLMVYINVEKYKGPGEYSNAQMFVGVQDRTSIYRWSSDSVHIIVGADHAFAVLPPTRLEAEPLLVDCRGPMNNYQCGGRSESSKVFMASAHQASGTMQCDTAGGAK